MLLATIKTWYGSLKSLEVTGTDLYIFIGSEFTQHESHLRLPGEVTTQGIRHHLNGDEITLISKEGVMMGGGDTLSPDERRIVSSAPHFVECGTKIGVLEVEGLQEAIRNKPSVKTIELEAAFILDED